MPGYTIKVVDRSGAIIAIASTSSAKEALEAYRGSVRMYHRLWVSDEAGEDVSEDALIEFAAEEGRTGL